ncbi:hypothetical protein PDN12_22480 [Bacillus cereus]|nr:MULTISPECIES: hypothetical protein [Bacillus cereus group]WIV93765.1 hypothetical protein QNH49_04390 [Bacillus bombysepticus]MDA2089079.1 hypothetical protein [Bacillus cereus]MDA2363641.1 hypothetical protein [Bacillus cereus]MDA2368641.1 hypothetical protein [Bacillus cereus]MDA2373917.1 hypothetical protein [Bacillus cereus]
MRKFPANSFVTRSQFGFGGGGGGQGSGQMIDKGAKQPIFFLFFNTTPPFKLSFITIKCKSMADVLTKEGNIKN